jgi:hypothetical protein
MANSREYGFPGWLAEGEDPDRISKWVRTQCWDDWIPAYRPWWRQVEENVRMLSGRHWDTYIQALGDFVPLDELFASDDERWRKYPVFNWVAHYYKITLSKLTENAPVLGFMPATPDDKDARLAQLAEPLWKAMWHRMEMPEQMFRLYGWCLTAARGVLKLRWNPDLGPSEDYVLPAVIHLALATGEIQTRQLSEAPYLYTPAGGMALNIQNEPMYAGDQPAMHPETGQPIYAADEGAEGGMRFGAASGRRLGDLQVEVPSPVGIIVPHGPEPFHRKPWVCQEYMLSCEDAWHRFGVELEPDDIPAADVIQLKLEYGTNYGMPTLGNGGTGGLGIPQAVTLKDHVRIRELWVKDYPQHETLAKGRLVITCAKTIDGDVGSVLYDDVNPYWVDRDNAQAILPYEAFDLIPYAFRQEGTSDLEIVNPLNRALNRRMGGMMDFADHNEQPPRYINRKAGIGEEQFEELNRAGALIEADLSQGDPEWSPEARTLPESSVQMAEVLRDWMQLLGSQPLGSEGTPVTPDASGELQREVRFDLDRIWGGTKRLHSYGWARVGEKMIGIAAACLSDDRMLTLVGEDQAWDFLHIGPELFQGSIHVYPTPESEVLESRQDKQNRILALAAAFPQMPSQYWIDLLNYPDLRRLTRPGGPAWAMAERENTEMALGMLPPVLPEHDHMAHIENHRRRMQTVEYRDAPDVQKRFRVHLAIHEQFAATAVAAAAIAQGATSQHAGPAPSGSEPQNPSDNSGSGTSPGSRPGRPQP